MRILAFAICFFLLLGSQAQTPSRSQLESMTEKQWQPALVLLSELVSMPNDAVNSEDIEVNIRWCEEAFASRGWKVERLDTGGIPLLLLEKKQPKATKTALFYFHVDGQAVDISKWDQPNAYLPVLKTQNSSGIWEVLPMERLKSEYNPEWRIFARSSSDDKGPLAMFITAFDALEEAGMAPDYHVKVILDFEEEQGSPRLPAAVVQYKGKLAADLMLIMDGPRHTSDPELWRPRDFRTFPHHLRPKTTSAQRALRQLCTQSCPPDEPTPCLYER